MKLPVIVLLLIIVVCVFSSSMISQTTAPAQKPKKAVDPVCGLTVDKLPELSYAYKGETYYFCSKADLDKFKKTPDKYFKKTS
jgi:YHS domain-containing protein